ncbi:MAG: hypothetical protein HY922_17440 [Elusimicrobia bacterium]|nr:hypothetical protein [Elusimicrobiota bacterium]
MHSSSVSLGMHLILWLAQPQKPAAKTTTQNTRLISLICPPAGDYT